MGEVQPLDQQVRKTTTLAYSSYCFNIFDVLGHPNPLALAFGSDPLMCTGVASVNRERNHKNLERPTLK